MNFGVTGHKKKIKYEAKQQADDKPAVFLPDFEEESD